jgi:PAS domain S-box-containing protein
MDISDHKRSEEILSESEKRFRTMADGTPVMIWVHDANGAIEFVNRAYCDFFGVTLQEVQTKGWQPLVHPDDADSYIGGFLRALADKKLFRKEARVRQHDGQWRWVMSYGSPRFSAQGVFLGMAGSSLDISDRKATEDTLQDLNKNLEQRAAERTAEVQRQADQLRALATQLSLTEQSERKKLAQILHDDLQQLLVAAQLQIEFIEQEQGNSEEFLQAKNLLDEAVDKSRSLAMELHPPILMRNDLSAAIKWLAEWKHEKFGLQVKTKCSGSPLSLDYEVFLLLFQSVRELLFNIVKHSGVKEASVELNHLDGKILLTIEDEGIGFDMSKVRSEGGESGGFGLFSIRERLAFIGGQMEIQSAPGQGSRFRLMLPVSPVTKQTPKASKIEHVFNHAEHPPEKEAAPTDMEKKIRVMLVDDHEVVRQGVANLIDKESDFEIVGEACDGDSSIDMVGEVKPDVVLMDVNMPVMNGIEATRIIHDRYPSVQIIGFSINNEWAQKEAMLEAGAVDYFVKRGSLKELIETIRTSL